MAKLFYKDKPLVGLDISSTGIKVMAVDPQRWLVTAYGSIDLEPSKMKESFDGDGSYIVTAIEELLGEKLFGSLPSNHVAIAIPTARTYSRTFSIPRSLEKKLADAVQTEADQYIPIPTATLYLDYEIIERSKDSITVLMSAVSRPLIDSLLTICERAKLVPVAIEPSISAVTRTLTATEDARLPTIIVDIGATETDIAILDEGSVRVTGGLAVGSNSFTIAIAKKFNISLESAHQYKVLNGLSAGPRQQKITDALKPSLERITAEIKKIIRYYDERMSDHKKLEQLLVVGSGSNVPGIGEYFTDALVIAARVASPWQEFDFGKFPEPAKQFRPRYISVAGLASIDPREARR